MLNINCNVIRRSKFDPLWNIFLVGGMQDDEPFLGYVNLQGNLDLFCYLHSACAANLLQG